MADSAFDSSLRASVATLRRAHPALAEAIGAQIEMKGPPLRTLERLKIVHRLLEDELAIAKTSNETELIDVTLRLRERALAAREEAEQHLAIELRSSKNLRKQILGLQRGMMRGARGQERLEAVSGSQRTAALESRRSAAEVAKEELAAEVSRLNVELKSSTAMGQDLAKHIERLDIEHGVAMEENALARDVLAKGSSLESYRKSKLRERTEGDRELQQVQEECEIELSVLQEKWEEQQARFRTDMAAIEREAKALRDHVEKKRAGADHHLEQQSMLTKQEVDEADLRVSNEQERLREIMVEKELQTRRLLDAAEQHLVDARENTQRCIDKEVFQVNIEFQRRSEHEKESFRAAMLRERKAVHQARELMHKMDHQATKARVSYKGHVMKSGTYVRSLDPRRKSKLMELWTKL